MSRSAKASMGLPPVLITGLFINYNYGIPVSYIIETVDDKDNTNYLIEIGDDIVNTVDIKDNTLNIKETTEETKDYSEGGGKKLIMISNKIELLWSKTPFIYLLKLFLIHSCLYCQNPMLT